MNIFFKNTRKKASTESGLNIILYVIVGFVALMVIALLILFWKDKSLDTISNVHNTANNFISNAELR